MPRSGKAAGISPTPAPVRAKLPLSGVCSCAREMNHESNRSQLLSWSDITLQLGRERLIRVIRERCQSPVSVTSQAWLRSTELQTMRTAAVKLPSPHLLLLQLKAQVCLSPNTCLQHSTESPLGTRITASRNTQRPLWMQHATSWSLLNTHERSQLMHTLKAWCAACCRFSPSRSGTKGSKTHQCRSVTPGEKRHCPAPRCQETLVRATSSISLLQGASSIS